MASTAFDLDTEEGKASTYTVNLSKNAAPSVEPTPVLSDKSKRGHGSFVMPQAFQQASGSIGYVVVVQRFELGQHKGTEISIDLPASLEGAGDLNTGTPLTGYVCKLKE